MRSWRGWSWDDGNFGGSGLEPQATGLLNKAAELRAKAYYAALSLEGDAKGKWGYEEVEQAKRRADW